jgi:hypothetical protein
VDCQKSQGGVGAGRLLLPLFWPCTPAKVGAFGRFEPPRAASTLQAATASSGGVPSISYRVPPLAGDVKFERVEEGPASISESAWVKVGVLGVPETPSLTEHPR